MEGLSWDVLRHILASDLLYACDHSPPYHLYEGAAPVDLSTLAHLRRVSRRFKEAIDNVLPIRSLEDFFSSKRVQENLQELAPCVLEYLSAHRLCQSIPFSTPLCDHVTVHTCLSEKQTLNEDGGQHLYSVIEWDLSPNAEALPLRWLAQGYYAWDSRDEGWDACLTLSVGACPALAPCLGLAGPTVVYNVALYRGEPEEDDEGGEPFWVPEVFQALLRAAPATFAGMTPRDVLLLALEHTGAGDFPKLDDDEVAVHGLSEELPSAPPAPALCERAERFRTEAATRGIWEDCKSLLGAFLSRATGARAHALRLLVETRLTHHLSAQAMQRRVAQGGSFIPPAAFRACVLEVAARDTSLRYGEYSPYASLAGHALLLPPSGESARPVHVWIHGRCGACYNDTNAAYTLWIALPGEAPELAYQFYGEEEHARCCEEEDEELGTLVRHSAPTAALVRLAERFRGVLGDPADGAALRRFMGMLELLVDTARVTLGLRIYLADDWESEGDAQWGEADEGVGEVFRYERLDQPIEYVNRRSAFFFRPQEIE